MEKIRNARERMGDNDTKIDGRISYVYSKYNLTIS